MRARHLLAALAVVATPACDDGSPDDADAASTPAPVLEVGPVAATELVVGDCLGQVAVGVRERSRIDAARVVSCDQDHALEIFASFVLDPADFSMDPPDAYPGQERIVDAADQGCTAELEDVADESAFGLIAIWPTQESWLTGDRTVACAAFPSDGAPFDGPELLAPSSPVD